MGQLDVAVVILKHEGTCTLKNPRTAPSEARGMAAADDLFSAGFHANESHSLLLDESIENAHGVAPAANTCDDCRGQCAGLLEDLCAGFAADYRLEFANHEGIRMRPEHRSEQVIGVFDVGDPITHCLVDGVLQRPAAGVDRADLGAQQPHAEDVERLPLHIFRTHVDVAFETEKRASGGRRNAVLSGAGFGHDAAFPHSHGEKGLPHGVVDFVGSRMSQVLALEENPATAADGGESRRLVGWSRPSHIMCKQAVQPGAKCRVVSYFEVRTFESLDRLHQRLGNEAASELTKIAARIRVASCDSGSHRVSTFFITANSALSLSESFRPGERSTPDDTSIPEGPTQLIASPTFSGVRPPARITGRRFATVDARPQSTVIPVPPRRIGSCTSRSIMVSSGHRSIDSSLASANAIALRTGRVIALAYSTDSSPCN